MPSPGVGASVGAKLEVRNLGGESSGWFPGRKGEGTRRETHHMPQREEEEEELILLLLIIRRKGRRRRRRSVRDINHISYDQSQGYLKR